MEEYLVRFEHQTGVGLDPGKGLLHRKIGKRWLRYYRGGGIWMGGPETAVRFQSREEAEKVIDKYGSRKPGGSTWLGHEDASEIVTVEQALEDQRTENGN